MNRTRGSGSPARGTARSGVPTDSRRRGTQGARGPRHAHRVPFAVVITALVLGGLALLLTLNTAAAANELRRHSFAARDQVIAAQVQQLRNDIAASAAPGNLASAAALLGMVPAENPAFLVAVSGQMVVRGKPAAVPAPVVALPARHSKAKKSPAATKSPKPTTTTTDAAGRTSTQSTTTPASGKSSTSAAPGRKSPSPSPSPPSTSAAPSPTPTPTVTLPGGPR
jgi:hypothetical protein